MKNKFLQLATLALLTITLGVSCKKDKKNPTKSTTTLGSNFFIEGKGLRKIWGMQSATNGLSGFHNGHFTYSAAADINMLFVNGLVGVNGSPPTFTLYRKKINFTTGAAIDLPFPSNTFNGNNFLQEDDNCYLIPYTDKFAYASINGIDGEPSWLPQPGFGYYVPKIYETQQIAQSYYRSFDQKTVAAYYTNGIYTDTSKLINAPYYCSSLELSKTGTPLIFTVNNTTVQVHDFATTTQLSSLPINLFSIYTTLPPQLQTTTIKTKRSADGSKIIGLIIDGDHGRGAFATFVYDITTNTLTKKIDDHLFGSYPLYFDGLNIDFDEEGNVFYPTVQGASYQIKKVSPNGESVVATDFMTIGNIIKVKAVSGKVFVVLSSPGNNSYIDDRGKGVLLVTVLE